ncbi:MAG TPA: glutathione S-transferase [Woeseiaceae bacterium]|nr:glutathione S-transferase [Woeseiaceae bacterium]
MKLYQDNRAPNPRRVRIFLAEKGIRIPVEDIDLVKGEHKTERFSRLNPMQRIPVLELDDGTVIAESMAICRYFEAVQPDPPLFGVSPAEQAVIEMWQRRVERRLLDPVSQCFRHGHPAMSVAQVPQIKEWSVYNKERAVDMLRFLNGYMDGRAHVAGDRMSVADITLLVALDFLKAARLALQPEHAALRRWHAEMSARPSATA